MIAGLTEVEVWRMSGGIIAMLAFLMGVLFSRKIERKRNKQYKSALQQISWGMRPQCKCNHTDENCCVKVRAFCAWCIADTALNPTDFPTLQKP